MLDGLGFVLGPIGLFFPNAHVKAGDTRRSNHDGLPSPLRGGSGWGCRLAAPEVSRTGSPGALQLPKRGAGTPTSGSSPQGGGERRWSCVGLRSCDRFPYPERECEAWGCPGARTTTASPPPCGEGQGGGAGTPLRRSPEPGRQSASTSKAMRRHPHLRLLPARGRRAVLDGLGFVLGPIGLSYPRADVKPGDTQRSNHNGLPSPLRGGSGWGCQRAGPEFQRTGSQRAP